MALETAPPAPGAPRMASPPSPPPRPVKASDAGYVLYTSDLPQGNYLDSTSSSSSAMAATAGGAIPHDYSRFYLDPRVAVEGVRPKIVGVLACQRDPYLRTLRTRVVAVRRHDERGRSRSGDGAIGGGGGGGGDQASAASGAVKKGQGAKGQKAAKQTPGPRVDGAASTSTSTSTGQARADGDGDVDTPRGLWELEFEDTVLFPEGGGQPCDTGEVVVVHDFGGTCARASRDGVGVGVGADPGPGEDVVLRVIDVFRRGLTAVHVVRVREGDGEDAAVPDVGREVELRVDWERRVDHMSLHTGQHLLSALCDTLLSLPTLSWFLPPHPSLEPAYVELPRPLTGDEAREVERRANELVTLGWGAREVGEDVRVWIESKVQGQSGGETPAAQGAGPSEQEKDGLGLEAELDAVAIADDEREWGDRESRGLPKDYANGIIRTAVIDGIDRSLCCGTHHPSLSRVGLVHVIPPSLNTTSNKPTRLYALAGPRACRALLATSHDMSTAASHLGCARLTVAERVEQREQQRNASSRQMTALRSELAGAIGRGLAWELGVGGGVGGEADGTRRASLARSDEATHDFEFMGLLNTAAVARLIEIDGRDPSKRGEGPTPYVLVVASSLPARSPSPSPDAQLTLVHITSFPHDLAKQAGERFKAALDAIEGGEKGRARGGGAKGRWMGKVSGKWGKKEQAALAGCLGQAA